ncbi:unnamed protein product [[Candida] boidinii]|uniref:Unnamed protein product n=1 Tax=Candida boidinii TaxID=5477 RepID=A0A9W6WCH0_CANBO|nr:hypothetical protein B5S30_g652 [[Candida] boidinii]GME77239.1 unnamed protein product [[Candida] boidinii]GMG09436.1 unnamed protein product [[Candida] boidinii]
MSLEGALEEERKLIADILERQKLQASNTRGRDRSISADRGHSRGLSGVRRSMSRASSSDADNKYSISVHDPSERLKPEVYEEFRDDYEESSDEEGEVEDEDNDKEKDHTTSKRKNQLMKDMASGETGEDSDHEDEDDTDESDQEIGISNRNIRYDYGDTSEEEQISNTSFEFEYDDDGSTFPNYANGPPSTGSSISLEALSLKNEENAARNKKLIQDARKAEKLDQVLAAERGLANAKSVGSSIPKDVINNIEKDASDLGTSIDINTEKIYQEDKERKDKLKGYAIYKKKLVSPSAGNLSQGFAIPYTSDVEEKVDTELAKILNEKVIVSDIEVNNTNARAIRTITRGNFFEIVKDNTNANANANDKTNNKNTTSTMPKSFVICMDFSEESKYALEWCIGTVLVDGSVLYIINVIEDDDYSAMQLNGIPSTTTNNNNSSGRNGAMLSPTTSAHGLSAAVSKSNANSSSKTSRETTRRRNVERMTKDCLELLKLTKLQVHVVIESVHHPIPRYFIVEVIHHLSPTLVVVGSKGQSAIKGVLLGSLSNYLVRKSSVPVMVVRNKIQKFKKGKQFSNTISTLHSLAEARID